MAPMRAKAMLRPSGAASRSPSRTCSGGPDDGQQGAHGHGAADGEHEVGEQILSEEHRPPAYDPAGVTHRSARFALKES